MTGRARYKVAFRNNGRPDEALIPGTRDDADEAAERIHSEHGDVVTLIDRSTGEVLRTIGETGQLPPNPFQR